MKDVSEKQGRTVLFVSHNMAVISNISDKVILVDNGKVAFFGNTEKGIGEYLKYLNSNKVNSTELYRQTFQSEEFNLNSVLVTQKNRDGLDFINNMPIDIELKYEIKTRLIGLRVGFDLYDDKSSMVLFRSFHDDLIDDINYLESGIYTSSVNLPIDYLKEGAYTLNILVGIHNQKWLMKDDLKISFNIVQVGGNNKAYADTRPGIISPGLKWLNY